MRLAPLYQARFEAPERWSIELAGANGSEEQALLFVVGRCEGGIAASLRAANFPRRRADGTLTPDFRGVLETDDGATILFAWHGYGVDGRLVGAMTHLSDDERYRRLNDVVCAVAGVVEQRAEGFEVVLDVAELVWEPPAAR